MDFELAAEVQQERAVADLADGDALDPGQSLVDLLGVVCVGRVAGDVDDDPISVRLNDIKGSQRPPSPADCGHEAARRTRGRWGLDTHSDGITRAGVGHELPLDIPSCGYYYLTDGKST